MRKIFSQMAGAAAVVAAVSASYAYAQGAGGPGASAPANATASSTGQTRNLPAGTTGTAGTAYEGGVNNGSTYVRSNDLGNASPAERPAPGSRTQSTTTPPAMPAVMPAPAPGYDNSTSSTPGTSQSSTASTVNPDLSSASNTGWNADGTRARAARADRN